MLWLFRQTKIKGPRKKGDRITTSTLIYGFFPQNLILGNFSDLLWIIWWIAERNRCSALISKMTGGCPSTLLHAHFSGAVSWLKKSSYLLEQKPEPYVKTMPSQRCGTKRKESFWMAPTQYLSHHQIIWASCAVLCLLYLHILFWFPRRPCLHHHLFQEALPHPAPSILKAIYVCYSHITL
jgi:hypothetical protein